jgi:siroheme synthase
VQVRVRAGREEDEALAAAQEEIEVVVEVVAGAAPSGLPTMTGNVRD